MEKVQEDSASEFRDGAQTKINDEITDFQNANIVNGVVDPHKSVQF